MFDYSMDDRIHHARAADHRARLIQALRACRPVKKSSARSVRLLSNLGDVLIAAGTRLKGPSQLDTAIRSAQGADH